MTVLLPFYFKTSCSFRRMTLCFFPVLLAFVSETGMTQSATAPWVGVTFDGGTCSGKQQGYGPYDYLARRVYAENLKLVEDYHFTPDIEQLARKNSDSLAKNIDYTLRAWPNHHRALRSMMRLRSKSTGSEDMKFQSMSIPPMECYFNRAIRFSPKDSSTRMLQAMFYHQERMLEESEAAYEAALSLAPEDLQIMYNFALLLVEKKQYGRAKSLAETVYAREFPFPGLQRKLKDVGHW